MADKLRMPTRAESLPGRSTPMRIADRHLVLGSPMRAPFAAGSEIVWFGMGCYWGAERKFWQTKGVLSTAVGFAGGFTPHPTYRETCTGLTGHAEVVQVVFDPHQVTFAQLLKVFWENHDPTQGFRQGNDVGTTYRSVIFCSTDAQLQEALGSRDVYQRALTQAGRAAITTEIELAPEFFYAEDEHQQYLHKNPHGYCGLAGTGVTCQIGTGISAQ